MNKLYMMIGLPASGKSTIAKDIAKSEGAIIVSSDEIRKELFGDINDQSNNVKVFEEVINRTKFYLANKYNVIIDATNINYKKRRHLLNSIDNLHGKDRIAILVATPYEECLERNKLRERKVPEEVIKRMYFNFYIPQYYEGFDDIQIRYNSAYTFELKQLIDIPQDNPHHTLSVLKHCNKVGELLSKTEDFHLAFAGLLHDIGKLNTKTFTNMKGETTNIAHYYNHEKVSAYNSLFSLGIKIRLVENGIDVVLRILKLIQWHMILHFDLSEKTITKYKNMLGEDTWRDLEILHKADCEAR